MPYCPRCGDPLADELAKCPRCLPRERRGSVTRKKPPLPAARFAAVMRGLEVVVAGSSVLLVGYMLGTGTGLIPPLDVDRLMGTPAAIAAGEFLMDPMAAREPPPFELELADAHVIDLRSGDHFNASFVVSDPRPCTLTGQVRGLAGGKRDVEVYVLDEEGYLDWQSGIRPRTIFESGRSNDTTLEVELPSRGRYHLLLSNRFSFLTAKRVRIDDARLRCA